MDKLIEDQIQKYIILKNLHKDSLFKVEYYNGAISALEELREKRKEMEIQ